MSSLFASPRFLPRVMWADAASCAATGAAQLLFAESLVRLTGLPAALLAGTGVFLLAYALAAAAMASRARALRTLIGLVAAGNLAWALGCVGLMLWGGLSLTLLGKFWLGAQALTVVVLADLQWAGLRHGDKASRHDTYSGKDIARHKMLKSSSN